ncbi:MAG: ferrous iron transport protein A [Lachnospiraceae bacterium]|nr:ferrous iron transport protein A [Lachnospiraceae bacterium]
MPLTMSQVGEILEIRNVSGKVEIKRHLEEMGFVKGTKITVVSENAGNLIVNLKGSRVAIGKDLAMKIAV